MLRLTAQHKTITWEEFGNRWVKGEARILPQKPVLLYCMPGGPNDFLAVPEAPPKYCCCAGGGCGCVNMWGKPHNGECSFTHAGCAGEGGYHMLHLTLQGLLLTPSRTNSDGTTWYSSCLACCSLRILISRGRQLW